MFNLVLIVVMEFKTNLSSLGSLVGELKNTFTLNPKKNYRVTIKEWRENRSQSQNNMYWLWLADIDKQSPLKVDTGTVKGSELWHEVFKKYYCPVKNITNGERSLPIQSTKILDVGEMTFYLNKIENWCIDRGLILSIPESSEYYKLMQSQTD